MEKQYGPIPQKANTTSSMFITSTISNPNMKQVIKAMAMIIHQQLIEDENKKKTVPKNTPHYNFSEEKYIEAKPEEFSHDRQKLLRTIPTIEQVNEFVYAIYMIAEFSHECCIISLIYLFRLKRLSGMPILALTWRPLVFTSMLIAQKVWDDSCLKNADFLQIYPFFTLEEANTLEYKFLELIEYDCGSSLQLYAKYFFELRTLVGGEEEILKKPLTSEQGDQLEIKQKKYADGKKLQATMLKSVSLNDKPASKPNAFIN